MADTLELESDFALVQTLENFPVVWDPDHAQHDKVEQRRVAFRAIARVCKGETVEDADYICKRYKAIRSKLVRRLKPSKGPIEVRHQHWALEEKLQFLKYKLGSKRKPGEPRDPISLELPECTVEESYLPQTPSPRVSILKRELSPLAPMPRFVVLPPPAAAAPAAAPAPATAAAPAPATPPSDVDNVFCQMLAFSLKELPRDVALELRGQIFQLLIEAQRQAFQS